MGHKRPKIETNRVDIDQGNSGKVRELIQWSVKSWKSQGILPIYLRSQGKIA